MIKQSIYLLTALFTLNACSGQSGSGYDDKNADEVMAISNTNDVIMIDVRTPGEVANGYLKGTDYFFDINASDFAENIKKLDREKTYVLICHSGARSKNAARFMLKEGFTNVVNMSGGMRMVRNSDYVTR